MKKNFKNILQFVLFFGGGLMLSWWQFHQMTPSQKEAFFMHIKNVNYFWVPIILSMSVLSHYLRALRWKMLLEPLGKRPSSFNLFSATMIGYLANSFVPRLGEVLKCTLVAKSEKIKFESIIGTIVVERIIDLLSFVVFVSITLATQYNRIADFIKLHLFKNFNTTKIIILIAIVLVVFIIILILTRLAKTNKNNKIISKLNDLKDGTLEGFKTIRNLKKPIYFWLYTISIWSMYLLQMYLSFRVIDATSNLPFAASLTALFATTIAMITMPNGLGVMPPLIASALLLYQIPVEAGEALGWMSWAFSVSVICIVSVLCIAWMSYRNFKNK